MVELLKTKLYIPRKRAELVPRPRLVEQLNAGLEKRLTLISAPAGFGKTTLVVAWLNQIDRSAAWLSLDEGDNELSRFLAYLGAAFQQVDEEIGAFIRGALQSTKFPATEDVLAGLLNDIVTRKDPLILILDDYHLITEAAILEALNYLIHHQPPQLHIVLMTREDPDLPLARLRAQDQLNEVRAKDLRFTQEETDAFLRGVMGLELSMQDVAVLEGRTEGWVVGLQLAGLSMQKQTDLKAFIADFSGSHRHILDYLTDEVLQRQPEGIRTFLLQTAILDRLSGPLCDALTGRPDSDKLLAHLEAANLFVIPLDEERRWYRYHHLFAELLRNQLSRSQPKLVPELHRRASDWHAENGSIQAAIEYALQAPDLTRATRLIEQHALPKLYQGEVAMVVEWFDRLPEELPRSSPMLSIGKAWALALMQRGTRRGEVESVLHAADQALDRVNADEKLRNLVAGHTASIQAFMLPTPALMNKEPERIIALSQEAQRLLPEEEKAIRSITDLTIGYGYLVLAEVETAGRAYQDSLEDGLNGGNYYMAIYGPINLISIALLVGKLTEALQLCDTNIERFNRILAGRYFPPIGALYVLKGCILLEIDRLEEAEQLLTEGLNLVRWTGDSIAHRKGYAALARLRAIQGNRPAMLETVKTLEEIWPEFAIIAQALRQRLLMRYWFNDRDVQKNADAWLLQSGIKFDELAVIESVDPTSITYFESYLNTAYVLARLAKRRPGAYPVEGLHSYLIRQQDFAVTHGFIHWIVAIAITRSLLFQSAGNQIEALETLKMALSAAANTGLHRIFVDECDSMHALLGELTTRVSDDGLSIYVNHLLESMRCMPAKFESDSERPELLSERELEVLQYLAKGLTYEEIGHQLFLSLSTIQSHIKNIYSKLLVNKRVQAIERAREMGLI